MKILVTCAHGTATGPIMKAKVEQVLQEYGIPFETRERAARTVRNPQTGKEIQIAASITPAFKAGKKLKDALNVPAKGKSAAKKGK